jgi:hypothetical protein
MVAISAPNIVIHEARDAAPAGRDDGENEIQEPPELAVTKPGDGWRLGRHRLVRGDARDGAVVAALLAGDKVDLVFTDPPITCRLMATCRALARPSIASLPSPRAR